MAFHISQPRGIDRFSIRHHDETTGPETSLAAGGGRSTRSLRLNLDFFQSFERFGFRAISGTPSIRTILVVDDDPATGRALARTIQSVAKGLGIEAELISSKDLSISSPSQDKIRIITATSSKEIESVLGLVRQINPDLILTDTNLGNCYIKYPNGRSRKGYGPEFLSAIREAEWQGIGIGMSGYDTKEIDTDYKQSGANAFRQKPILRDFFDQIFTS